MVLTWILERSEGSTLFLAALAQGKSLLLIRWYSGWAAEPVLDVVRIKPSVCLEQNPSH